VSIPGSEIIAKSLSTDRLVSGAIKYKRIITFLEAFPSIAIDSTGTKFRTARHLIEEHDVAHLKAAYFEASITNFTATDAEVQVILVNDTDSTDIASISFTSNSFRKRITLDVDTVKNLVNKEVSVRVDVTTASATSGATAAFRCARLILVYEIP